MASICLSLHSFSPSTSTSSTSTSSSSSSPAYSLPPARCPQCCLVRTPLSTSLRCCSKSNRRGERHVVRMAPEEEKLTRRNPLDFPSEWEKPRPGRRADIIPQFSPMKTPLPPPLPSDPPFEEEEFEEEEEKEEEEKNPDEEEPEKPEE